MDLRVSLTGAFLDPVRINQAAENEVHLAVHAGQTLAAVQSGVVVGLRWVTAGNPCVRCQAIGGKVVKPGTPFHVDPKGGPYSVVYHPPYHKNCKCRLEEVIEMEPPRTLGQWVANLPGQAGVRIEP